MPGMEYTIMEMSEDQDEAEFGELRSAWKSLLTGGEMDVSNQSVRDYITNIDIVAEENWNALIKLGDAAEDTRCRGRQ